MFCSLAAGDLISFRWSGLPSGCPEPFRNESCPVKAWQIYFFFFMHTTFFRKLLKFCLYSTVSHILPAPRRLGIANKFALLSASAYIRGHYGE